MTRSLSATPARSRKPLLYIGVVFFLLALGCIYLYRSNSSIAFIWLANVIGFTFLVRHPRSEWAPIATVLFLASISANLAGGHTLVFSLGISIANLAEILVGALLLESTVDQAKTEPSVQAALKILLTYVFVSRPIGTLIASLAVWAAYGTEPARTVEEIWLSGAVGALLLLLLGIMISRERIQQLLNWRTAAELIGIAALTTAASYYLFVHVPFPTIYIIIPLVLISLRRGAFQVAVAANLVILMFSIALMMNLINLPLIVQVAGSKAIWAASSIVCVFAVFIGIAADQLRSHSRRISESEARFRGALEFAATGFILIDPNGTLSEANPYFCSMLGYEREDLIGLNAMAITHPDDVKPSGERLDRLTSGLEPYIRIEKRFIHKSGRIVWAQVKASLLKRSDGHDEIIAQIDDITEHKFNQERILSLTERLGLATRALGLGVWDFDLESKQLACDEQTFRLYGMDLVEPAPDFEVWRQHIHPEDRARAQTTLYEAIMGLRDFDIEYKVVWPSGETRTLQAAAVVQRTSMGTPLRVVGVNWDITELKQNETALLEVRTQLQSVIDAASEFSIIATDLKGVVVLFNTGAERMLGYTASEVVGQKTIDQFHLHGEIAQLHSETPEPDGPSDLDLLVEEVRKGKADAREWTYVRKGGSYLTVSLVMTAIYDTAGRLTGFLGIARDITQQRQAQQALAQAKDQAEAANRAKSEFLANMSHEIRTPMNAVLGMAHLLGSTPLHPDQREYLNMINLSGRSLLRIINDILDFSKIEANHLELVHNDFVLDDVVDALASIMSVNVADKDLEMVINVMPDVPPCFKGDALRLQQVLINLTSNAIKFTPQGEVDVRIELVEEIDDLCSLRFSVRDTGVGISSAQLDRLFAPFAQGDGSVTRRFGGTGLGLAISKRLVELMGGRIGVSSKSGRGSEFWFILQLRKSHGIRKKRKPAALKNSRLLAVDDNASSREAIRNMASSLGWQAETVASASEALTVLREDESFTAVILDWTVPEAGGLPALREIARAYAERAWPLVVMVNPFHRDEVIHHTQPNEVDALMNKPLTATNLLNTVQEALESKSAQPRPDAGIETRYADRYGPFEGRRMLLVEDNTINQIVARGILEQTGAIVDVVGDGLQAVQTLRDQVDLYDVVLMDVQMPIMDGYTATKIIRNELRMDVPILAVTAGAMESERQMCLASGMNDIITKPLDVKQMIQTIGRYLS